MLQGNHELKTDKLIFYAKVFFYIYQNRFFKIRIFYCFIKIELEKYTWTCKQTR